MKLEENLHFSLLLDLYSPLLTDKQAGIMTAYLNDNLGLSEIAESSGITRQAVRDIIERSKAIMVDYEEKLHLLSKFDDIKGKISSIIDTLPATGEADSMKRLLNEILEKL